MTRRMVRGGWAVAFVLVASACAPDDGGETAARATVVDSAGVRIVRNHAGSDTVRATDWVVRETATFGAGPTDPDEAVVGRPIDAARAPDGSVLILDQIGRDVKVYGADGAFSHTIGRPGQGPGEFERAGSLWSILMAGDTVLVPDPLQGRVSRFLVDGTVLDPLALDGALVAVRWEREATGSLVAQTSTPLMDDDGRSRSLVRLLRFAAEGGAADTIHTQDPTLNHWGSREVLDYPMLVTAPVWALRRSGQLVLGRTDRSTLDVLDRSGTLESRISHPAWRREPIPDRLVGVLFERFRAYRESLGPSRDPRRKATHLGQESGHAYTSVFEGPEGTLWVQRPMPLDEIPGESLNRGRPEQLGSTTWDVLSDSGESLGAVEFPAVIRVLDSGAGWVLGVTEGDLNVQTVRLYSVAGPPRLSRPRQPPSAPDP